MQAVSLFAFATACQAQSVAESGMAQSGPKPFAEAAVADFDQPWAMDFLPGSSWAAVTEKPGRIKLWDSKSGRIVDVIGVPKPSVGGQGGLGDIQFEPEGGKGNRYPFYLSWVEAGEGDLRGAVVGRGMLVVTGNTAAIEGLNIIWRQTKVTGGGHFSHRLAVSPDGQYLFVTSGDRQKMEPAQSDDGLLGKVLRLTRDGKPALGNPWASKGGVAAQFWSMGHRNLLGIDFAPDGRLWQIEMGPKHGDELNLVLPGRNYGWPKVSMGDHYDGKNIPDHTAGDGYEAPKAYWVPAISPGGLLIYSKDLFKGWKGDALVPGLSGQSLSHVEIDGDKVVAKHDYPMGARIREVEEGPDGAIYVLEDERNDSRGRLIKLTPAT
ncbi:MAG: PQQ-dependent sugar dehydrogenase [Sphingomicrobium sp.]